MKERPIIFNLESVRAVLAGMKTMTRRVVKAPGVSLNPLSHDYATGAKLGEENGSFGLWFYGDRGWSRLVKCPHGKPGDRLWVREVFAQMCSWDRMVKHCDCGSDAIRSTEHYVEYRADSDNPRPGDWPEDVDLDDYFPGTVPHWSSSIFMPRTASRILLEIADVRVERLQEITTDDAYKEGMPRGFSNRVPYKKEWDRINAKRGFSFEHNPWVWVISFKRIQHNN